MIGLDRLIKKPGVIAAGQFDENGDIKRAVGDMPDEAKKMFAQIAKENDEYFKKQCKLLSDKIDSAWQPYTGWAMWSGKYALCMVGKTGVVVEIGKADFNQLMIDLINDNPTGPRPRNY
jgi:roadblock/LC7 domain-containing protein